MEVDLATNRRQLTYLVRCGRYQVAARRVQMQVGQDGTLIGRLHLDILEFDAIRRVVQQNLWAREGREM